jgi:hypothetical protein
MIEGEILVREGKVDEGLEKYAPPFGRKTR